MKIASTAVVAVMLASAGVAVGGIRAQRIERIDFLGDYPSNRQHSWSDKLQGVANDRDNWFFTQEVRLWKFPITHDLALDVKGAQPSRGILSAGMPSSLRGYNHFGDLDQAGGRLYIPVEGKSPPVLAVFRASDLGFVGSAPFITGSGKPQREAGWVAIHPTTGLLYTSNNEIGGREHAIFIYRVTINGSQVSLQPQGVMNLTRRSGFLTEREREMSIKPYLQGGVFSSDGRLLFLCNGKDPGFDPNDGGIWIFEAKTGRMITKSTPGRPFAYEFHPSRIIPDGQEPEGITYFDLDGRRAPRIGGGQLHGILLDFDAGTDNFWLKHYRINVSP